MLLHQKIQLIVYFCPHIEFGNQGAAAGVGAVAEKNYQQTVFWVGPSERPRKACVSET